MISISRLLSVVVLTLAYWSYGYAATSCTLINSAIGLGAYDAFNPSPTDAVGSISVACSRVGGAQNVTITIAIGPSLHTGSAAVRKAKHSVNADLLSYNVYRDSARTLVWGNSGGVNTFSQTIAIPNNTTRTANFIVNARIDALQDVRIGDYADSLQVSVLP